MCNLYSLPQYKRHRHPILFLDASPTGKESLFVERVNYSVVRLSADNLLKILRRVEYEDVPTGETSNKIAIGNLTVYPDNYEALIQGEPLDLTSKEFELLLFLINNKGRVMTRNQLLNTVWGYDFVGDTRMIDVNISPK